MSYYTRSALQRTQVFLDRGIWEAVQRYARQHHTTGSFILRELMLEFANERLAR